MPEPTSAIFPETQAGTTVNIGPPGRREPYRLYRDPLPTARYGRRSKYPFAQMKIGDCFYIPLKEVNSPNAIASAARQWAKRNSKDWTFSARVAGEWVGLWGVA